MKTFSSVQSTRTSPTVFLTTADNSSFFRIAHRLNIHNFTSNQRQKMRVLPRFFGCATTKRYIHFYGDTEGLVGRLAGCTGRHHVCSEDSKRVHSIQSLLSIDIYKTHMRKGRLSNRLAVRFWRRQLGARPRLRTIWHNFWFRRGWSNNTYGDSLSTVMGTLLSRINHDYQWLSLNGKWIVLILLVVRERPCRHTFVLHSPSPTQFRSTPFLSVHRLDVPSLTVCARFMSPNCYSPLPSCLAKPNHRIVSTVLYVRGFARHCQCAAPSDLFNVKSWLIWRYRCLWLVAFEKRWPCRPGSGHELLGALFPYLVSRRANRAHN